MKHSSGALVSVYGYRKKPFGIKAMISYDGGENWDTDYVLYDGASSLDLGYPASVERRDGTILTVFYEREESWENFYEESNGGSAIKQIVWSLPQ